jgi:sulfate-transporting ATPase
MLDFLLLGLGASAAYALLGQGIVLIFRGSGIVNLSHGALAMLGAYIFGLLRGDRGWSTVPAMLVAIAVVTIVGVGVDQVILRKLRHASAIARLIATLGVFLVVYAMGTILWGQDETYVTPIFPSRPTKILGAVVPSDRLYTLLVAVVLTAVLTAIWRFTRIGWLTEAVAENERTLAALGWSSQLISTGTWAVGAALAALAGILICPFTQLNIGDLSLLIIPALAAALIGGFRSFPLTLVGGLVVGIGQSEAGNYIHTTGSSDALPFVLIMLVMIFRGSALPLRGHLFDRLAAVGLGRIDPLYLVAATVAGGLLFSLLTSAVWLAAVAGTFSVAIILLSLVVVIGYAGQLSLAQYALAGIGALVAAQLVASAHWPFIAALPIGVVTAAISGLVFALPALRTRGVNLAVVTLGLGVAVQSIVFNNASYTGSLSGVQVGQPSLFGWSIGPLSHPGRYAAVTMVLFAAAAMAVANLRRGRSGRQLLAIRSNERAAAALGINVTASKLYAFGVAGALAGLGGVILAFTAQSVVFTEFSPINSITAVADVVIGGVGYIFGAFNGAQLSSGSFGSIVAIYWQKIDLYLPLIGGVALLLTLMVAPDGNTHQMLRGLYRQKRILNRRKRYRVEIATVDTQPRVVPKTLFVENLSVRYGGVTAVSDLNLSVKPGQIVALIGPNGAGKTSFTDAVTGFTKSTGTVRLDDQVVSGWPAHERSRAGMVRSFQGLELFDGMTVSENLQAASETRDLAALFGDLARPGRPRLNAIATAAATEFGLLDDLDKQISELSFGQRKLVAIARAVASSPSVLILDEPVAGLDDERTAEFATLVRRLAQNWGIAILVIEHDMNFVMSLSDEIVVMEFGRQVATGTPTEIASNESAIAAYLGDAADVSTADEPASVGADQGVRS